MLAAEFTGGYPSFGFAENTDDLFVGKTLLHGDVLMWLMKTLLTSGCTNQRGAGQRRCKVTLNGMNYRMPLKILERNITLRFQSLISKPITLWKENRSIESGLRKNPSNKCQNRLLCVCSQNQPEQVTGYMIDCMLTEDTDAIRC